MELSLLMRLRIGAAAAVGIVLIGIFAWPIAAPAEPLGAVLAGSIGFGGTIMLVSLAFLAGFIAYFLCWPYGRQLGVLAVPSGLGIWAVRSGNVTELIRSNPALEERQGLFAMLKWEPIFWLAIVAAGFIGVLVGQTVLHSKTSAVEKTKESKSKSTKYLSAGVAVAVSILIAQFFIRMLAQDISLSDSRLGSVVGQPNKGQIVCAVLVSFGLAGFVVKKFLNIGYIWPIIGSAFVTAFVSATYAREDILWHLSSRLPVVFFSNSVLAVLPIQMVAFGAIGAIGGYWIAIRFDYWRQHEMG